MTGELDDVESALVRAHLSGCAQCSRTTDAMRKQRDETELPRLRLLSLAPAPRPSARQRSSSRWKIGVLTAGLAAAASVLIVVAPARRGERIKGRGIALSMYVQHEDEVRRSGAGDAVRPGDAVRFAVTTPVKAYVAVLSVDAKGRGSIYYPGGGRAEPIAAGLDTPLPLGTRLDETRGEERVVGLFCSSPVELEPIRSALEAGRAVFPDGCQVTQWTFVKR
jgi:hypothetical protein